ncbi:uncharacterized vacuolar membrane protein yml018c [Phtheirospermum japonicum]|uniref:Uncharacterized vacuolar membrane protein yml018c n=1 Tax=Phtheirospermum japonicum TaxID=374723 RepID=A0A830CBI2_9LAMI|nr:uncharacterized vacuolar membrane protein yml018c [Phtheirospermum japonicum]
MNSQLWRWVLGLIYIFLVATIWIAASFVVQSVVDEGVSPFLVTYICNSLFVVYIPLVEIGRYLEDKYGTIFFWRKNDTNSQDSKSLEKEILLENDEAGAKANRLSQDVVANQENADHCENEVILGQTVDSCNLELDAKGRWTRWRVAKFTWLKLTSVLLCMGGTIIVSLGDSGIGLSAVASNPILGDFLALISSAFYAAYITLIRQKLPDDDDEVQGRASMAQFLGFLGLFNLVLFFPVALMLDIFKLERFNNLNGKQFGLIVGKGLLDNVLSDYLWAKAVLLTTTTVATAGLSIQVPLAAIVDSLTGHAPHLLDYIGGAAIMVGFTGINIPSDAFCGNKEATVELESVNINRDDREYL